MRVSAADTAQSHESDRPSERTNTAKARKAFPPRNVAQELLHSTPKSKKFPTDADLSHSSGPSINYTRNIYRTGREVKGLVVISIPAERQTGKGGHVGLERVSGQTCKGKKAVHLKNVTQKLLHLTTKCGRGGGTYGAHPLTFISLELLD